MILAGEQVRIDYGVIFFRGRALAHFTLSRSRQDKHYNTPHDGNCVITELGVYTREHIRDIT